MSSLRHLSTPVALLSFSLSLALAAMACDYSPEPDADSGMVVDSQPSRPQAAEDEVDNPPASEEPSGDTTELSGEFAEIDCACADYQPSQAFPWGNSSLICRYDWSGPNIDQNALGFSIVNYQNHTDRLATEFQQDVKDLTASLPPQVKGNDQGRQLRNDDEGYGFVVYGPGGGGKQGDIPLCGNGRGVYQVAGEFLIETDLFACDLPYSDNAYVSALTDMETCARQAVARVSK